MKKKKVQIKRVTTQFLCVAFEYYYKKNWFYVYLQETDSDKKLTYTVPFTALGEKLRLMSLKNGVRRSKFVDGSGEDFPHLPWFPGCADV